jgi:hypothetical protein
LVRWGVQNAVNTVFSPWGIPGSVCVRPFPGTLLMVCPSALHRFSSEHRWTSWAGF